MYIDYKANSSGNEVVLFPFDNYSIPSRNGLQLSLVEGKKLKKVIECGKQGEPDCSLVAYYGTVIRIEDKLHMWYLGGNENEPGNPISWYRTSKCRVCYATSTDGVNWEKPKLGLVSYNGNSENNLVDLDSYNNGSIVANVILYEPEDPDTEKRFKMIYECYNPYSICVAFSSDGLRWKNSTKNPVIKNSLEHSGLIKRNGCYYVVGQGGHFNTRSLLSYNSYDFETWSETPSQGFRRDNFGFLKPREWGHNTQEQVHLGASLWNRGNVIIGFYGQWHGPTSARDDRRYIAMDIGMVLSHDAIHYSEPLPDFRMVRGSEIDRHTMSIGPNLTQGQGFENIGENTYFWYGTWGTGAGNGVRVAQWQRDRLGFFSVPYVLKGAEGDPNQYNVVEGQFPTSMTPHFITCAIDLEDKDTDVFINADGLSDNSFVTIEILDEKYNGIPDFSGEESIPVKESGFSNQIIWKTKTNIRHKTPVRLKVNFEGLRREDVKVYAIYLKQVGENNV